MLGNYSFGLYLKDQFALAAMAQSSTIYHEGSSFIFATPNALCRFRADTFSTKEPETLEWIDHFTEDAIFWDVGANVGLYSVYAAKQRNSIVWAFEPSVFNLECLARNISLNEVSSRICIAAFALNEKSGPSSLHLTTTDWGGAMSTFDKKFGFDGNDFKQAFEFKTLGYSLDEAMHLLGIPQPKYLKMDVDGLEHLILKGGRTVIENVCEILIEINDDFLEQADICKGILESAGLVMKSKRHGAMFESSKLFGRTYNQIWTRP